MGTRCRTILPFKILLLLVILLLVGVVSSSCVGTSTVPRGWSGAAIADGTLFVGSMGGRLVALNMPDGSRLWEVPLETQGSAAGGFGCAPASTSVAIYGSPAVAGDLIYVGGYNGKIYTISISTRLSKDKYLNEKDRKPIIGGPLVAGGTVYIGSSNGLVYALDVISLDEKWKFETGDKVWATPAIDGDTLFISSFDKKLYALKAADGSKKWEFATEGAIVATPVVFNNTVYIGSFDRYLYAVDAIDGSLKWKFMAENWFWAKPVIYDGVVYAANLDGKVYILDAETGGEIVDAIDLGGPKIILGNIKKPVPVSSSPVVSGNSVIVATEEGKIYSIDTSNNQKRLLVNLGEKIYAPLAASQGIVYIHSAKDVLYAVDAQSGAVREFNIKS